MMVFLGSCKQFAAVTRTREKSLEDLGISLIIWDTTLLVGKNDEVLEAENPEISLSL